MPGQRQEYPAQQEAQEGRPEGPGGAARWPGLKANGKQQAGGSGAQIDECLIAAKNMDRAALEDVIGLLRKARNAVVWKIGQ